MSQLDNKVIINMDCTPEEWVDIRIKYRHTRAKQFLTSTSLP